MYTPNSLFVSASEGSAAFLRYDYADDRFNFERWLKSEPTSFKKYWSFDASNGVLTLSLTREGRYIDVTPQPDFSIHRGEASAPPAFFKQAFVQPYSFAWDVSPKELALNDFRLTIARRLRQLRAAMRHAAMPKKSL